MASTAGSYDEPRSDDTRRAHFDAACLAACIPWVDREALWPLHRGDARRVGWAVDVLVADHGAWKQFGAALAGDDASAAAFHDRWTRYVRAYCGARFPPDQRAEIASAFFERSWRLVPSAFRWQCPFCVYLRAIVVNVSRDVAAQSRLRRTREMPLESTDEASTAALVRLSRARPGAHDALVSEETSEQVRRALASLVDSDRRLVVASLVEGRRGEDVARELGISRAALHQRLHRARVRLRELLAHQGAPW